MGEGRCAAEIPVGIAGSREKFAAFPLEADIPAPSRTETLGVLRGQLGAPRDISTLRMQVVGSPLILNYLGHYVFSAVYFGERQMAQHSRPRISSRPSRGGAQSCPTADYACPTRRVARLNLIPPHVSGLKSGHLRGFAGWASIGPRRNCDGAACKLGPCLGRTRISSP